MGRLAACFMDSMAALRIPAYGYGIRYEFYGGPKNTGSAKDALVRLGSGSTLAQQLVGASLVPPSGSGNEQLFRSSNDFEVRSGAAYDLLGTGRTMRAVADQLPAMECPQHKLVALVGTTKTFAS